MFVESLHHTHTDDISTNQFRRISKTLSGDKQEFPSSVRWHNQFESSCSAKLEASGLGGESFPRKEKDLKSRAPPQMLEILYDHSTSLLDDQNTCIY